MAKQPSYRPLEPCVLFDNGAVARHPVLGTVARGHLRVDSVLFAGRISESSRAGGDSAHPKHDETAETTEGAEGAKEPAPKPGDEEAHFATAFPFPITEQVFELGYHRYTIYCVVCHDPLGTGYGKIVERGYTAPPSYHIPRLRNSPVGRLFAVVSEGYGSMPSYGAQIRPRDRWAIVAYLRALQLSQHYPAAKLSHQMRDDWERQSKAGGGIGPP